MATRLGRFDGDVVLQPKPGTVEGVDERLMELAGIRILYLPPPEKLNMPWMHQGKIPDNYNWSDSVG